MARFVTPWHPRGWINARRFVQDDGRVRVALAAMPRFRLPALEIVDCPNDGEAMEVALHAICLTAYALHLSVREGRPIEGGHVVGLTEDAVEDGVAVRLEIRPGVAFRLVDAADGAQGCPSLALAGHVVKSGSDPKLLLAMADTSLRFVGRAHDFTAPVPEAADALDRHIDLCNLDAWIARGQALLALGREAEAMRSFEEAVARLPDARRIVLEVLAEADVPPDVLGKVERLDGAALRSARRCATVRVVRR
jgi:hypothetical protein